MTAETTAPAVPLDLTLGERGAAACGTCNKPLPAIEVARFELEDADTGRPLCTVCADRTHRGLRVACLLLNTALDLKAAGAQQQSSETLQAVVNGVEMILQDTPPPRYRGIRVQPVRRTRRRR